MKKYLYCCITSSKNSVKQVLNQLIKDCYLVIYNTTLLINENIALYTTNQKQQQKWLKPVLFILQKGIIII